MTIPNDLLERFQVENAIEIPFSQIENQLERYARIKGLATTDSQESSPFSGLTPTDIQEQTYVDGYFAIGKMSFAPYPYPHEEIELIRSHSGENQPTVFVFYEAKGTKYSNNPNLLDRWIKLSEPQRIINCLYSYDQLCALMEKLGAPAPKPIEDLPQKNFQYDVETCNQKSHFTLFEAASIAANIMPWPQMPKSVADSINHYLGRLQDCIDGINQHEFLLDTIDAEKQLISKSEFLRWCEYQEIETGLFLDEKEHELAELQRKPSEAYPKELQLAMDCYDAICRDTDPIPTNKTIEEWLRAKSTERGIKHMDSGKEVRGLSNTKLERMASMIKSQLTSSR